MPDTTVTVTAGMPTTVTVTGGVADVTIDVLRGATGATGAAGPNTVTTSTTTNITGIIKGNGSVVSQAIAGTDYAAALGANDNYVTDAQLVVIGNTSGTNTGDQFTSVTSQRLIGRHAGGSGAAQEVSLGTGIEFSGSTIQRSALTGDITASAGSNATTLASTIAGAKTLSGQLELTGQAATTANSAMTRSLVEASFSNPITQGGTIIQVPATALQRSTLINGGTSLISNFTSPIPRVTCTTTLDSSAVLRAIASDGVTSRCDSSNRKLFADKYGWFFIGLLGARGLGSRGKVIIGGNSTPAEMIVEGTLGSDGIALESYPLVANTPRFRLVVRNGATTTVGAFSGTGVYSIAQLGQWWIVMESGTTSAYYRLEQGAWNLICSVAAVPATSTVVSGNGIAIVAYTPDAAATAGSNIQLNIIYETFGITPD